MNLPSEKTFGIVVGLALALVVGLFVWHMLFRESDESAAGRATSKSLYVEKVDGCEYVVYANGPKGGVCHKGDCSNPIHSKQ